MLMCGWRNFTYSHLKYFETLYPQIVEPPNKFFKRQNPRTIPVVPLDHMQNCNLKHVNPMEQSLWVII